MAAKKNVEEVKDVQETVTEEKATVNTEATDEAKTAEPESTEKKEGFIKRWANGQKEEFKAAPVKYILKKVGQVAVGTLAVVGGATVVKKFAESEPVMDDTVQLLTDNLSEVADDVKIEEF